MVKLSIFNSFDDQKEFLSKCFEGETLLRLFFFLNRLSLCLLKKCRLSNRFVNYVSMLI